jgi:hypothetical protein
MKTTKRKSNFRDKVNKNRETQKNCGSNYGYLQLPKGLQVFKEEEGRVKFDIIPYEVTDEHHLDRDDENGIAQVGELWYKKPFRIHRNIGIDNETIVCPGTFGRKCPVCEQRAKMVREKADKEDIKPLNYSLRNLYLIIPIGSKKHEEEIHIWEIAQGNFQSQLHDELEENPDNGNFPDIEDGQTIKVRFSEETLYKNKYYSAGRIDFEERAEQYDESILKDIPCLDDILKVFSYKEIEAKFFELGDEETEDKETEIDEDDEKPVRKKKVIKKEIEEDDEDDEPVKKTSIKKKKVEVEEPEEEEEEEKEEEEEPVKKTFKRKKVEEPEEDPDEDDEPKTKKGSKNTCPFGHRFGKDNNKFDDCDDCKVWDNCDDAQA